MNSSKLSEPPTPTPIQSKPARRGAGSEKGKGESTIDIKTKYRFDEFSKTGITYTHTPCGTDCGEELVAKKARGNNVISANMNRPLTLMNSSKSEPTPTPELNINHGLKTFRRGKN